MADFFKYIIYCFSLIPTWLTAVFLALCIFLVTYVCMLYFTDKNEADDSEKYKTYEKSTEFDELLASVLASKEKGNNMNINMIQPEIEIQKAVPPDVVAAISAAISKACPTGIVCSIESA